LGKCNTENISKTADLKNLQQRNLKNLGFEIQKDITITQSELSWLENEGLVEE
jgi:hypothetical protein